MGSVLVAAMVQEGVAELPAKKFHPFFSKPIPALAAQSDSPIEDTPQLDTTQSDTSHSDSDSSKNQRKRRNTDSSAARGDREGKKARRNRKSDSLSNSSTVITPHCDSQLVDEAFPEHVASDFPTPPLSDISIRPADQTTQPATSLQRPDVKTHAEPTSSLTPPKARKVLKWNPKTGTLGSPPKPKPADTPTRLVRIKYGRDETNRKEMGDKISQILDGEILFPLTPTKPRAPRAPRKSKNLGVKQATSSQTTHPFFGGKLKKLEPPVTRNTNAVTEKPRSSKNSVFISSPFSPKKARSSFTIPLGKAPQFGIKSGGTREPGALHPLWPAKDMSHIRGSDNPIHCANSLNFDKPPKKSKGQVVNVRSNESVLDGHCGSLNLDGLRKSLPRNTDHFEPAPKELRIPKRHFESGRKLQGRVRPELRTYKVEDMDESQDESDNKTKRTHPAISRLYGALETNLSAYDKSTCETQSWAQKYAPATASEVLQAGKEAFLLKEWLQTLRVQSVGTGATDSNGKGKGKSESAPRKKRKKDKLDGFIVDSDEEANFMDEISEDEDDWAPAGSGVVKKTVIRSGDAAAKGSKDQGRLTNAAVVSGPHGSGKTAAVYAVAKELGFEIFEINSGSRRSGRDLLERVGDMTRNHLVQHHTDQATEGDEEDAVSKELKSGKQGMMTAFFKPKPMAVSNKPMTKRMEKNIEPGKQSAPRNQKQSLILLEEVDVLYEEDKHFWATLMGMIEQSKRPFIMTCNDESLVPLQSLSLHGIFRFSPPPTPLAVDLCILVAANEGHLLNRPTVDALYKCRSNDLRATLTELNYWCQIGVGDRRGGFDWFVLRWPKGKDLDENGDVIRVISEGTYCKGMGWLGRDLIATCPNQLESEEEAMRQSWDSWKLDIGDWNNSMNLDLWAQNVSNVTTDAGQRLDALAAYDDFCDAMSCADLLSSGGFGTMFKETLDSTLPELPTKSRDDFIIGRRLLEVDLKATPCSPHVALSMSLKSFARNNLLQSVPALEQTGQCTTLGPVNESQAISMLHTSFDYAPTQLTRLDLAFAFDPIAVSEKAIASTHLDPSVFDRTKNLIVLDVAPWVRGIVEFDHQLMLERVKLSNLISEGGKRKRMRTTRSAYSALEGGERRATRRERYFGDVLNTESVRRTAGKDWNLALEAAITAKAPKETTENLPSSPVSGEDESGDI
ncbi:hypothetical protein EDB81DRAFT_65402 [Dactylonectria macrodidyma]|uniref:ATPase AAA-type core domain-containing protein n=1 Tax=Dactylonectria macrodidyma TaxID=307937 RepID=A0A9P9ENC8_9HYPO|nr:hypothetical protein EDB81DRAFT_65402 [Dactylonectria macrodidyma]